MVTIGTGVTVYGRRGWVSGTHRRGFWVTFHDGTRPGAFAARVVKLA